MATPIGSPTHMLSPHATVVRAHPARISQPHLPSSPLPHLFEPNVEPSRDNINPSPHAIHFQLQPPTPQPAAAASSGEQSGSHTLSCSGASDNSADCMSLPLPPAGRRSVSNGTSRCKYRIYYAKSMASVAQALVKLDERFQLAEISWGEFADSWPNLFIQDAHNVKQAHVCFLANFHDPAVFFEQFSVITALPKLLPKSFKLFLPFFPTGTMERVSRLGEVATANTLARLLSTIPVCAKGPAQIAIFDIHALQNQFYFKDTVLIRLGTCVNLLLERIALLPDRANVNIAFPDDGAAKRFGDMFARDYPQVCICHKVRDGEQRMVKLKEGDVQGRHMVIVDDLVQSGGTLIECAKELLRNGAACVSCYVTHAIFPNDSFRKFFSPAAAGDAAAVAADPASSTACLRHFFLTDSNPWVADKLRGKPPFEVLSIARNIAEIILDA